VGSIFNELADDLRGGAAADTETGVIDLDDQRIAIAQNGNARTLAHAQVAQHGSLCGISGEIEHVSALSALSATQRGTVFFVLVVVVVPTKEPGELAEFFGFLHQDRSRSGRFYEIS
jgi:hypothetical protein